MQTSEKPPFKDTQHLKEYNLTEENEESPFIQDHNNFRLSNAATLSWTQRRNGTLKSLALILLPSFLASRWKPPCEKKEKGKTVIGSLDGLRGIACFFVFNDHFFRIFISRSSIPIIFYWPYVSSLWGGKAAVAMFFVISGYVLSYKALQLVRDRKYQDFQKSITSSVFRRVFRLCLPPFIAACILCLLAILGAYDKAWPAFNSKRHFLLPNEIPPKILPTAWQQIWALESNAAYLLNSIVPWGVSIFATDYYVYDGHVWTIPQELRSSMALFTLLVGTSRMRTPYRLTVVCIFIHHVLSTNQHHVVYFFIGMLLAECDLIRKKYVKQVSPKQSHIVGLRFEWSRLDILWVPLFFAAWGLQTSTGLVHNPFLPYIGTTLMVWSAANSTILSIIFCNPVVTYLGRISYALYLVHGGIIRSLGYVLLQPLFAIATGTSFNADQDAEFFKKTTDLHHVIAYMLGNVLVFPLCIWAADLFCRGIDEPCVRFARYVEQIVSVTPKTDEESYQGTEKPSWLQRLSPRWARHRRWTVAEREKALSDDVPLMKNDSIHYRDQDVKT